MTIFFPEIPFRTTGEADEGGEEEEEGEGWQVWLADGQGDGHAGEVADHTACCLEGGGGGRFWGGDWGAGCRSARTRLAHGGGRGGAGCTMVQRRRHSALVHLPLRRKA